MEDQKPDKALLDQALQDHLAKSINQTEDDLDQQRTVTVKEEPAEDGNDDHTELNGTNHDGKFIIPATIKSEPSSSPTIQKKEQKFPSYMESKNLPPPLSASYDPTHDIPGPSTSFDNTLGDLNAIQMLQALAERSQNLPGPSMIENDQTRKKSIFDIDTSLILGAPSAEQSNELEGLGVSVYNQEEFEAGVMQQVDDAITLEEDDLAKQRAEKDLKAVLTDIRACKQEIARMDRLIGAVKLPPSQTVGRKDAHRKMLSIKTQRENKAKQLKKLRATHKTLLAKRRGSSVGLELSGDEDTDSTVQSESDTNILKGLLQGGATMSSQETEQERMIRLGEMTPFGTTMNFTDPTRRAPAPQTPVNQGMTDFEKAMLEKDDLSMTKHKKNAMANKLVRKRRLEREQQQALLKKEKEEEMAKKKKFQTKKSKKGKAKKPKVSNNKEKTPTKDTSDNNFEDGTFFAYKPTRSDSSEFPRQRKKRSGMGYKDLKPNWGSDNEMSDDGDVLEDSDEYVPDEEEVIEVDDEDEDYVPEEIVSSKGKGRGKKRTISDDIQDGVITSLDDLKKAYGVKAKKQKSFNFIKKCQDDSSQDQFYKRLRENKKKRLREKQKKIEKGEDESDSSEDEDMEFDGGLKIPASIWYKLYKYQKTGVKWLWELHQQQAGGIVGDEMGLGKTIQMIAFLAGLKTSKLRSRGTRYIGLGPVLIVCPTTVMHQWVKEFHTWAPDFRVAILHDSGSHSGTRTALVKDIAISHSVLVTSYSSVRLRQDILLRHDWHYVILDEGHQIRNPDAHVTLACKQFRTPHRLILSGSPMQNNLKELWSLFDFVFPGKLGTLPVFMEKFSVPISIGGYANATSVQVQTGYKCACVLRDTINPYLLRRMKSDVKTALQLPQKNEQVLFCRLTDAQMDIYKEYLESKECQMILNKEYQVFAGLITLRKICNHPDLVSGGPKLLISEAKDDEHLAEDLHYGYWKRSGKMVVVESLLKLWKQQNHRVLFFSQSKQLLDIMEDFIKHRYTYMRMDGGTPIASRQTLINRYNADESIFVFLLTTRVGGLGVNLTGANRIIIFDPDWNPSTDTQARERAWRIGQTKQVTIYRLLTTGTIEEKIYHRQIFKTFLSNRVLKDPRQRRFFKSNDLFELFSLGSSASTHGTETSAIFAGTGSDVRVPMIKVSKPPSMTKSASLPRTKSANSIRSRSNSTEKDSNAKSSPLKRSSTVPAKLSERQEKQRSKSVEQEILSVPKNENSAIEELSAQDINKNGATIDISDEDGANEDTPTKGLSSKEVTLIDPSSIRSKADLAERARQIAKQLGSDKKEKPDMCDEGRSMEDDSKASQSAIVSPDAKANLAERARQIAKQLGEKKAQQSTTSDETKVDDTSAEQNNVEAKSPEVKASLAERAKEIARQLVSKAKDGGSHHHHSPGGSNVSPNRSKDKNRPSGERSSSGKKELGKKKKKKKKKHDASIEGHRISNLAKHTAYRPGGQDLDEEEEKQKNAHEDSYVLQKLFKKSGVHSALQHDNIMNSSNPDYLLVENEADRVAKEAVRALKQSRQRCMTAASGVPTWTGSSGHSGAPPAMKKPRFGQKANRKITPLSKQPSSSASAPATKSTPPKGRFGGMKKKHFQGDAEESLARSSTSSPALPDSTDLLAKMRARNHVILDNEGEEDENATGTAPRGREGDELLTDIHQFVSFQGDVDGQASTAELLRQFKSRLPKNSTVVFKALLTKICDFHRNSSGLGVWKLKPEFR